MIVKAAILRAYSKPFEICSVDLAELRQDEILVELAATGICHTDLGVRTGDTPVPPLPVVLGHEGSGRAVSIGEAVTKVSPGDHLVLTFSSCGECRECRAGHRARCHNFIASNMAGVRSDGSLAHHCDGVGIHGGFFGQSSFATYAIVREANAVNVRKDVPIELLGPLGCGVQTGAGTVLNYFRPAIGAAISIFGVGAVGLSAVMAARLAGCSSIVAIDVNDQRLQLAADLGATHCLRADLSDLVGSLRVAAPNGFDHAIDTSGAPAAIAAAITTIGVGGSVALLAMPKPGAEVMLPVSALMMAQIRTVVEGDSDPDTFIPELIEYYRAGRFPFDRLVTFYDFDDINSAADDLAEGRAIKPVLLMNRPPSS